MDRRWPAAVQRAVVANWCHKCVPALEFVPGLNPLMVLIPFSRAGEKGIFSLLTC